MQDPQNPKSLMHFTGRLGSMKVLSGGKGGAGYAPAWSPGSLEITLVIEGPKTPTAPTEPWPLKEKAEPAPVRKKGEAEPTFADRVKRHQADMSRREALVKRFEEEKAAYEEAVVSMSANLAAYAQVVGILGVMGGQRFRIGLAPIDQAILPGFFTAMLPAGDPQ